MSGLNEWLKPQTPNQLIHSRINPVGKYAKAVTNPWAVSINSRSYSIDGAADLSRGLTYPSRGKPKTQMLGNYMAFEEFHLLYYSCNLV
jgi:hypothetical protein